MRVVILPLCGYNHTTELNKLACSAFEWASTSCQTIPLVLLGQGCLRACFGEQFISTQSGFKRVLVNLLKWVQKWVSKRCFLGATVGKMRQNPLSTHLKPISGDWRKPFLTHFIKGGGGNCSLKWALRQSRPSITHWPNQRQELACLSPALKFSKRSCPTRIWLELANIRITEKGG